MAKKKRKRTKTLQVVQPRRPVAHPLRRRDYAGALHDRLTDSFRGEYASANEVLRKSLPRLRARSRTLVMDNDYAKNFIRIVQRNIIGPKGIRLQSKARRADGTLDQTDNAALESAWRTWGRLGTPTVDGRSSWLDVQRMVLRALAQDGEVLVRLYRAWPDNAFGFAIEVLEADWLDECLNKRLDDEREIVMGVEVNRRGRPLAYHLLTEHPGRISGRRGPDRQHERVPADAILHIYVEDRPGQLRGVPWVHTAARRLHLLGGYEEAEVVAMRGSAQKFGVIKTPSGTEYVGDGEEPTGAQISTFSSGTIEQLPAGWDFQLLDPQHPTSAYPDATKQLLRGASAGLGVGYNTWAQDLEGVSFSSIRSGVMDERDEWMALQAWTVERLPERVHEAWLPWALLTEQVVGPGGPLPPSRLEKFSAHEWRTRGWPWVDPEKDQKTNERSVAAGFKTATEVAAEQGRDLEDIYRQLAEEQRLREQFGITIQLDGTAQPSAEVTDNAGA